MVKKFSLCVAVLLIFSSPIFAQGPCFNIENVGCAETSAESETCESKTCSYKEIFDVGGTEESLGFFGCATAQARKPAK
jgi:hypothetical protein